MDFTQFINHFVALLFISNPLAALPAVLGITRDQTISEKRQIGITSAIAVGIILLVAAWAGTPILKLLGIRLAAFQVAGGIIIFLMALSMLSAEESPIKHTSDEKERPRATGAIVPLAIPIIAGPGAISAIIVSVDEFPGIVNQILISLSILLVALFMGILLYFAANLEKIFGKSGINIINRLGGLVLAAIAVQILSAGFIGLFPILGTK